jgi:hypothetical protein
LIAVSRAAGFPDADRGGIIFRLLVFLTVVFAAVAMAWMLFLPEVLTTQLRQRTGFDATVESLAVNPFTGTVELRGLVVANPPTFPVRDFLELRSFSADAEVTSLFSDHVVFSRMDIDVARVTLVKRDAAQTNATAFSNHLAAAEAAAPATAKAPRTFLIRRLTVHVGEVVVRDHSGLVPAVQDFKLDFSQSYTDVTGLRQLFAPATLQALLPVGTALNGLLPGTLGDAVGSAVRDAAKTGAGLLKDAGRKTGEKIRGYFDALEESKKP